MKRTIANSSDQAIKTRLMAWMREANKQESIESVPVCTYNANKRKAWETLTHGRRIAEKSPTIYTTAYERIIRMHYFKSKNEL